MRYCSLFSSHHTISCNSNSFQPLTTHHHGTPPTTNITPLIFQFCHSCCYFPRFLLTSLASVADHAPSVDLVGANHSHRRFQCHEVRKFWIHLLEGLRTQAASLFSTLTDLSPDHSIFNPQWARLVAMPLVDISRRYVLGNEYIMTANPSGWFFYSSVQQHSSSSFTPD